MQLALVGLSHKTAPVEIRERLAFNADALRTALTSLVGREEISEALILSTCNRVEVVAGSADDRSIREFLCEFHRVPHEAVSKHLYSFRNAEAVRHVFRVAASLDSMMIGEPQILGQVKDAYRIATDAGAIGMHLNAHMDRADIVISSTGAPHFIITKTLAEQIIHRRKNKPMFFIDIAVPRDIDPTVNDIDNAFLYDIDDLQQVIDANLKERMKEALRAEEIVDKEVEAFCSKMQSREVVPTIVQLRDTLEKLRRDEIERNRRHFKDLSPEAAVDQITKSLINKILHTPIEQ